jgi:hypothetical protein
MGAWGTAIFSDDLAADVRGDWRELLLDGRETEAAAEELLSSYQHAVEDPDESVVFWLALAAAQMETGRLQVTVRDKALAIIEAGGDVERWEEDDPSLARQRRKVLDRLATKLQGPQSKPKRLRRQKPLGVHFDLGDVVLLKARDADTRALAVVVAHAEGWPRGTVNPVVELLAWEGGDLPSTKEMGRLPTVMCVNDLHPEREPYHRPHMWTIFTAMEKDVFGAEHGEVVATGVDRKPCGDHRRTDVYSEVGHSSLSWRTLCLYLAQEYPEDLRVTMEQASKRRFPRPFRR